MRTLYDAITPTNIPVNAEMVAGYIDGRYMWKAEHWARFPNAVKIQIACFATTNGGHVLDVEWGDSTPAEAPGWIRRRRAAGLARPTIYCNRSTLPAVQAACAGLTWDLWLADYTQKPHLDSRSVATQYADPGPVDLSLVSDSWYPKEDDILTPEQDSILRDITNALHRGNTQIWDVVTSAMNNSGDAVNAVAELKAQVTALQATVGAIQAGTPVAHTHPITANTGDPYK